MRTLTTIAAALFLAVAPGAALAHAHLDHAEPAVGATVSTAPKEITLWFTQSLEPAFSGVEVLDASGGKVSDGAPQISGNTMRISLKIPRPGSYSVHWHAVSVDTHKTEGTFTFTVGGQ